MAVLFKDTFTDADGTLLANHTPDISSNSQNWEIINSSIDMINNTAKSTASGDKFALTNQGISDGIVQYKHAAFHAWSKIIWRFTDTNNYFKLESGIVYRRVNGSQSSVLNTGYTEKTGDVISVRFEGNTHTIYANGSQIGTFTDANHQTVMKHGFAVSATSARIDDFQLESLTSGTAHTKSLSDSISTSESFSKSFSATVIDSVATGDGTNEGSAKSFSDSIAISESISKALTKWQTDGISTGDSESEATSKKLFDAITQTDVITAFGGKSVILTEGITVSDSVVKAVGRMRSDGLGLAESLGKQLSVRLYDVVISTDSVSTYLPNVPEYRHVMQFPVRLNTRQTVNVTISQRKQFDVDI